MVRCYLCNVSVHPSHWRQGFHRLDCAIRHRKALEALSAPVDPELFAAGGRRGGCGGCGRPLSMWTGAGGRNRRFRCQSQRCTREEPRQQKKKRVLRSTEDSDCFFCFQCDFAVCCAMVEEGQDLSDDCGSLLGSDGGECPAYEDCLEEESADSKSL